HTRRLHSFPTRRSSDLVANHVDEPGPAAAKADDLVTFTQSAEGDCADGGIEAGNVAAPGEDADDPFLGLDGCHEWMARPFAGWRDRKSTRLNSSHVAIS